jgi:carboxyl-terminal processing protease
MLQQQFKHILLMTALLALSFVGGFYIRGDNTSSNLVSNTAEAQTTNTSSNIDMSLFWKVSKLLEEKHIKATSTTAEQKLYGMIEGLTASYGDPYTVFFPPIETQSFKTQVSGSFEGVGMEVGMRDGLLTVIAPLKGSPAEKAGVKADDKIVQINASSTESMSVDSAIKLIRGTKGTPVTIKIYRTTTQKMQDITIIRDKIDLPIIKTKSTKDSFIISLYSFTESSPEKFRQALLEFANSGKKNLVIDLRNNPGGYLEAAVYIGSFFIEKEKVIVSELFPRQDKLNTHASKGFNTFPEDYKVIVLVNKGSASASEILAGALQDHNKAKVVGEKSFGKGSVQEYLDLDNGTSIKITVAKWLTPNGNSISDHGITPDVILPFKENEKNKDADNQLDYALGMFTKWGDYAKANANAGTPLDLSTTSKTISTDIYKRLK